MLGILYGIGPCTVFCAPVMVPLVMAYSKGGKDGVKQTLIFSLGRITSYALLGAISGLVGFALSNVVTKEFFGVFIIILGILIFLKKYPKKCIFIKNIKGQHTAFTSGIVLGLSPCLPLIGLLTLAAASGSLFTGLVMGVIFGLGTTITPLLILGFFAGKWAKFSHEFRNINFAVIGIFLILIGLASLLF